jgi:UDP-2,4-diacetamido-2,4,6-trideoxy-beta-L-altropyranose hydrolase
VRVLFILEAGFRYGLGHLMRCRSLLLELERRGITSDLWVRGERSALDGLKWPDRMDVRISGDDVPMDRLERDISAHVGRNAYDWIVVDGYGFSGTALYDLLTARGGRLFMMDDFADRSLKADVVLNQNTERADLYADAPVQARRFLLGPRYALISPDYREDYWEWEEHREVKRVLISFGGVDRHGRTQKVLAHLDRYETALDVDVVVGPYYPFEDELKEYCGRHRLAVHRRVPSLAPLMAQADLMISAAGVTVLQACCVGVPLIVIQTQDNQRELYRTMESEGIASCARADASVDLPVAGGGSGPFVTMFKLAADPATRRERSMRARRLVDGAGASRVAELLVLADLRQEVRT